MAEADKIKQFAIIQIMLGTDIVPKIKEADRNRPFCYNSDEVTDRSFSYYGRGTGPFATNQMLVLGRKRSCSYNGRGTDPFTTI